VSGRRRGLPLEVPQQVTDYYSSERAIAHGPWAASDCRQVISRWFDWGLIDCIAISWATKVRSDEVVHYEYDADWRARAIENGQHLVLAREDAGALLNDPSTWRTEGIGAGVMLCKSDEAAGLSFDDWFGKLAGLPDHLIFEDLPVGASEGEQQRTLTEPREVLISRAWVRAVENAAAEGLPIRCPVNGDTDLNIDWATATSETATAESIDDIVCLIDPGTDAPPFPFGRHRLRCAGCGAEQYLVVTRRPT
jgi:hypothetical protein